jgi:hypothetical protein
MPAKSKAQLRKAYALKNRGKDGWANELIEKTHTTKGLPERVKGRKGKARAKK